MLLGFEPNHELVVYWGEAERGEQSNTSPHDRTEQKKKKKQLSTGKQSDSWPEKRLEIRTVLSSSNRAHPRHGQRSAAVAHYQRENSRAVIIAPWWLELRWKEARFVELTSVQHALIRRRREGATVMTKKTKQLSPANSQIPGRTNDLKLEPCGAALSLAIAHTLATAENRFIRAFPARKTK